MKKLFFAAFMLIISFATMSGQRSRDVLYLKNGSIIYGKLLEASDSQYKIKTSDGSIFIYPAPEVEKFMNEVSVFEGRRKKGFGFNLEAGLLVGPQSSQYKAPFSFNILGNITASTKNIFSVGTGVEYFGQPYTPLFLEYKYLFHESKTTPFLFLRGGKLLYLRDDPQNDNLSYPSYYSDKKYSGEGTFTAGMGISWAAESSETYLSFGYRYAHTSYTMKNYLGQTEKYKNAYNRLEVKFGFKF
jgi:hypothetical protein